MDLDPEEFALDLQEIVQSLNLRGIQTSIAVWCI